MAHGRSNVAIADTLVISPGVVEKHVASIFAKLGLARPTATTAGSSPHHVPGVLTCVWPGWCVRRACGAWLWRRWPGSAPSTSCLVRPDQPCTLAMTSSAYWRSFAIFSASGSRSGPTW
jgi:hypothetical protein